MNYKDYNDYELIYMIREDSDIEYEYLFKKYEPVVKRIAFKYKDFVSSHGGEYDDLVQEGFISLHNAVSSFDENKNILFYTLANVCIERGMQAYCKRLSTKKNMIFNKAVTLEKVDNILGNFIDSPETLVFELDTENYFISCKNIFSFKNSVVFELRYNGFNYKEISSLLDIPISTVDSRLCKIKSKLKELIKVE